MKSHVVDLILEHTINMMSNLTSFLVFIFFVVLLFFISIERKKGNKSLKMTHFYSRVSFITGIVLGVILAVYLKRSVIVRQSIQQNVSAKSDLYPKWFNNLSLNRKPLSWEQLRYTNATFYLESDYLFGKIKLLCIILVKTPSNLKAANDTWAKGCNSINTIFLESRNKIMPKKQAKEKSSWIMLCDTLNSIDIKKTDWVFIVRDTSFVITENFRYYVAPMNARKKHYLGHAVKFWNTIYNSGDPGYALSAGTLKVFQRNMGNGKCMENRYWNKEDFYLGKYLAQLNITPVSTLDEEGLSTFHPYNWYHVFYPGENYYQTSVFPVKCCSRRSIAFQAIEGDRMYTFNYLFYKLQIFGDGQFGNRPFKDSVPEDMTWKQFLRAQNIDDDNISSEEYYKLWENIINDPNSFASNLKKDQVFDYD